MNDMRHPIAKARGLGSAKQGLQHWWHQRLSSIVLALLTPWLVYTLFKLAPLDQLAARALIAEPITATLLLAFVLALFWHACLGLQVVIEDYIHRAWLEFSLQIAVKLIYALAAIASILAIGRIVFSA